MTELKAIRTYGPIIDHLRGYASMQMPLLTDEQALLTRAIKSLSTYPSLMAQSYVHQAEKLLSL